MKIKFLVKAKQTTTPETKAKAKPKANTQSTIYVRAWVSKRLDVTASTPLKINPSYWNNATEKVSKIAIAETKDKINGAVDNLRNYIYNQYTNAVIDKIDITKNWLDFQINNYFGNINTKNQTAEKIYFTDWLNQFIQTAPKRLHKGKIIKEQTLKNYKTSYSKLLQYEAHKGAKLKHIGIDLRFYADFVHYCRDVSGLNDNTIGSLIGRIKLFCKYIELDGLPINPLYKHPDFMGMSADTNDIYLTPLDIEKIKECKIETEALRNARNWLVIGVWTGLRVSDLLKLTHGNIINDKIKVITAKTKAFVSIPMHPNVKDIINDTGLPYKISAQKFNGYIKEVAKLAGITGTVQGAKINPKTKRKETGYFAKNELVTSHICRRSFATNMYITASLHISTIKAITGHKSDTVFLKYIKVTNEEHTDLMQKYFDNIDNRTQTTITANDNGLVPALKIVS